MSNLKLTISFPAGDRELMQYVKEKRKQTNFSAYVRELIRKDIEGQENFELEQIYEYVVERLKKEDFVQVNGTKVELNNLADEEDKEIIMDLF